MLTYFTIHFIIAICIIIFSRPEKDLPLALKIYCYTLIFLAWEGIVISNIIDNFKKKS